MTRINEPLTTISGRFYEGMTRSEAIKQGTEACIFTRDFGNIDKNRDNILSTDEIINERRHEIESKKDTGYLNTALGGIFAITDHPHNSKALLAFDALMMLIGIYQVCEGKKLEKENQKLGIYA